MDIVEKIYNSKEAKSLYWLIMIGGAAFVLVKGFDTYYQWRNNVLNTKIKRLDIELKEKELKK